MGLDSGLSTQMLLRRDGALYMVNSITGEDATIQADPYSERLDPDLWGGVSFYIQAGI
jgi:hypothetical protein